MLSAPAMQDLRLSVCLLSRLPKPRFPSISITTGLHLCTNSRIFVSSSTMHTQSAHHKPDMQYMNFLCNSHKLPQPEARPTPTPPSIPSRSTHETLSWSVSNVQAPCSAPMRHSLPIYRNTTCRIPGADLAIIIVSTFYTHALDPTGKYTYGTATKTRSKA